MRQANVAVELRGVTKRFGAHLVLNDINLTIREGETLALLGPSGCGKSTTLNILAGFFPPDTGQVFLAGKDVTHVPSHLRNLGMVFQNYSLFPHLTAFENVAFGLVVRRRPKAEIRERVTAALKLVKLPGVAERLPAQLSGGQQQLVAVARALVLNPTVLLTDEPFSNLDASLRRDMQIELKRIQDDTGVTMVHVTHDQEEAITLADRVALLSQGEIDQLADPQTVFEYPTSAFGAEFMGFANLLPGSVAERRGPNLVVMLEQGGLAVTRTEQELEPGAAVMVCIREERVKLTLAPPTNGGEQPQAMSAEGASIPGRVENVIFAGTSFKVFVRCAGGAPVRAQWPADQNGSLPPAPGTSVHVCLPSRDARLVRRPSL